MLFSVIIPTCNRSELLVKCLDLLALEYQNFEAWNYEIIVSDDSISNFTQKLIYKKYKCVKWVKGPQKGPAANRNNGAKYAIGEWLVFTDDDCFPTGTWLSSYGNAILNNNVKVFEGLTDVDRRKQRFDEVAPINIKGGNLWSCNFAIKKNFFFSIKGFDENFPFPAMEDTDLLIRIKKLEDIMFLPQAKVIHPWRKVKPFSSYKKWLVSHKYILQKHGVKINFSYRYSRIKILIGDFFVSTRDLVTLSFRGVGFYFEKLLFNILMIFI